MVNVFDKKFPVCIENHCKEKFPPWSFCILLFIFRLFGICTHSYDAMDCKQSQVLQNWPKKRQTSSLEILKTAQMRVDLKSSDIVWLLKEVRIWLRENIVFYIKEYVMWSKQETFMQLNWPW